MLYLGIESSCDETAAAVVRAEGEHFTVLSNIVASQIDVHRRYGGVVPEIASRAHIEAISGTVREALSAAGVTPADLSAVGVTSHPGLIGALLVGVNFAKGFAAAYDLPLVPVDHIKAHIAAARILPEGEEPLCPPFLALAVSGGHTAIYVAESHTSYRQVGGTRDDAIGESFDKVGRLIGIPYPAGAGFDRLAAEGFTAATGKADVGEGYRAFSRHYAKYAGDYRLPSPALTDGSLDLSFSGLKTAGVNLLHRVEQSGEPLDRARFAAAYTVRAVDAVTAQLSAALDRYPATALAVAGGVAANSHLRRELAALAARRGVRLCLPPLSLCGDNGAMVAVATQDAYLAGIRAGDDLNASAADE